MPDPFTAEPRQDPTTPSASAETGRTPFRRLLIAGTYTPLCVVSLPAAWGVPILAFVAATALIGVVLTLTAFDRLPRISYSLYVVMC